MEFAKILINKLECVAREQEKDEVLCKKMQEVREQATVGVSFFFFLHTSKPVLSMLQSMFRPNCPIDRRTRC